MSRGKRKPGDAVIIPEELRAIRTREAEEAGRIIGVGEVINLNALVVNSSVPVVAVFGRLDVRQANMAYYSVQGYAYQL